MIAIREATENDVAALLPLFRRYCTFYESDPTDEGIEAVIRAMITAPEDEAFLLVATDEAGEVVGFASCQWKWSVLRGAKVILLDDLFVADAARGAGYADALIEETAALGRRHGAPLVVWFTQVGNHRAQGVYDRVGGSSEQMLEYQLTL